MPLPILAGVFLFIGSIGTKLRELGWRHLPQAFVLGAEQVIPSIAMQDGDAPLQLAELNAHVFRQVIITVVILRVLPQQAVVSLHKFPPEVWRDRSQVADDPAVRFKIPVAGHADKTVVGSDVRKERELAATHAAVFTLAQSRTLASQQAQMLGGICLEQLVINWLGSTLIPAPRMPKGGMPLEIVPFLAVSHRNSITDIAAERLSVGVVRRTHKSAILCGDRLVKMAVEAGEAEL